VRELTKREIAENLGISLTTLRYWMKKLNLEGGKVERGYRASPENWMGLRNRLYRLLERNGPMSKREAMKTLGLSSGQIEFILAMFPEIFQKLNFTVRGRKYSKEFYGLSRASPILTLGDDPRIVDFAASKIQMKIKTPYEAKSVIHFLKYQLGSRQAHAVVKKLGYQYKGNAHQGR